MRTFASGEGVVEDSVCGSGNGSVAAYIARYKHACEAAGNYNEERPHEWLCNIPPALFRQQRTN